MSNIDWVATGQMASAIAAFILVLVTAWYAYHTWHMVKEMREQGKLLREQVDAARAAAEASRVSAQSSREMVGEMKVLREAEFAPIIVSDRVTGIPVPTEREGQRVLLQDQSLFVFKNIGTDIATEIWIHLGFGSILSDEYYFDTSPFDARSLLCPNDTMEVSEGSLDQFRCAHANNWQEGYNFFIEFVYEDRFSNTYRSVAACDPHPEGRPQPLLETYVWERLSKEKAGKCRGPEGFKKREHL